MPPIEDVRGTWPCALCREGQLPRRGMICHPCELELDHGHKRVLADVDFTPRCLGRPVADVPPGEVF